jgi:hypothetical protein
MKTYLIAILVYCFSTCYSQTTHRSDTIYKPSTWIDFGIGWSTQRQGLYSSFNTEINHWLLSLSYDIAYRPPQNEGLFGLLSSGKEVVVSSASLKLGRISIGRAGIVSCSVGPSIVSMTTKDYGYLSGNPVSNDNKKVWGVSADVKIIPSGRIIGLGIIPYANINSLRSYMGITICIAIGQLKILKE